MATSYAILYSLLWPALFQTFGCFYFPWLPHALLPHWYMLHLTHQLVAGLFFGAKAACCKTFLPFFSLDHMIIYVSLKGHVISFGKNKIKDTLGLVAFALWKSELVLETEKVRNESLLSCSCRLNFWAVLLAVFRVFLHVLTKCHHTITNNQLFLVDFGH